MTGSNRHRPDRVFAGEFFFTTGLEHRCGVFWSSWALHKSRSIDCWERGRPVRTERAARKTGGYLLRYTNNMRATGCGRDVCAPSIYRPMHPKSTFWAKVE